MIKRLLLILATTHLIFTKTGAQACTIMGQTPGTAIPVCGTSVFTQNGAPACGSYLLPVTCTNTVTEYMDRNPYWYKFTCFATGTLGFIITPADLSEDYDWQLFDITGHNPNEVFSDKTLTLSYNWSGETGITGTSVAGTSAYICGGLGKSLFCTMPVIQQGHEYLLMISHYKNSQNGYTLEFKGGTASLYDPVSPGLSTIATNCDATILTVKMNKKLLCSSLAPDGSDFSLSSGTVNIVAASGTGCNGFDMDSVSLVLSGPLSPGDYTLSCITGNDGNTILDHCQRGIPVGENVNFTVPPISFSPMDSLQQLSCAPQTMKLIFKKTIACSSIAANGSDFIINGPQAVAVTAAQGSCSNGQTGVIILTLSTPIVKGGNYNIILQQGTDGNTILNECGYQTPAGSSISFVTGDTVSALFSYKASIGCLQDTIRYSYWSSNYVNTWKWNFDNKDSAIIQNPYKIYTSPGQHQTELMVSNGFCSDTSSWMFTLNSKLKADFEVKTVFCPEDSVAFKNKSTGPVTAWLWIFNNGNTNNQPSPPAQYYPNTGRETTYRISLKISDNAGCADSSYKTIKVLSSCRIAVPSAFSPNHDGLNDYLYPLNAYNTSNLNFRVYNRWGQLIFASNDWQRKWDGTINGQVQPAGIYVWLLQFTNKENGQKTEMKGTTMLVR